MLIRTHQLYRVDHVVECLRQAMSNDRLCDMVDICAPIKPFELPQKNAKPIIAPTHLIP